MAKLVLLSGAGVGKEFPFAGDVTIGRDAHCGIVLNDGSVSREHAKISIRDGVYYLCDLGSRNGTSVQGRRVEGETPIQPGQEILFGKVLLRLAAEAVTSGPDEILLEESADPVLPATVPPVPAKPAGAPAPVPARKKIRETPLEPVHRKPPASRALLGQDFFQYGGGYRFVILLAVIAVCAGLFFGARYFSSYVAEKRAESAPTEEEK